MSFITPKGGWGSVPATVAGPVRKCTQHPEVDSVSKCHVCSGAMCSVCTFQMAPGMFVCPTCIDKAGSEGISPRRKRLAWASLAIAIYCTVVGVLLFSGLLAKAMNGDSPNEDVVGAILFYLYLLPAVAGLVLGLIARERRLKNPPVVSVALIWNSLIVGVFVLLMIVGVLMG